MPTPYTPPYTITATILSLVAEIAGEVGRLGALAGTGNVPKLHRENRIHSIHASLAIENNTHPLDQLCHRPTFRANYLNPALTANLIEYTIPGKPRSRLQKYRLTASGKALINHR
jgi:hypothetical protein